MGALGNWIAVTINCFSEDSAGIPVAMKKNAWRAVIEVGFIVFLFYSNLLMGEFELSGRGHEMGWAWALADIFTINNFAIAIAAALIGYAIVEFLRGKILS